MEKNLISIKIYCNHMIKESQFLGEWEHESYTITKKYIETQVPQIKLFHTKFTPPDATKTICIVHGFGQHSTRFHPIADFYARNNFQVLLIDLRGFGYSGGARGSHEIRELENDVIHLLKTARQDLPLFLYAHSLGGLVTIKLLLQRSELNISGCIITSPLLGLPTNSHYPWIKIKLTKMLGDDLSDFIINSKVNPTALTKKTKYLHTIFQDRMMLPFLCVNMAKSIFESLDYVKENMNDFRYPVIVFHGKQDTVTNFEDSRKFVYNKVRAYKELFLFDKGYHELQHDQQKDELLQKSMDFIGRLPRLKNFGQMSTQTIPKPKKKKSHKKLIVLIIIILIFIIRQARTPGTIIANIIKKITGK